MAQPLSRARKGHGQVSVVPAGTLARDLGRGGRKSFLAQASQPERGGAAVPFPGAPSWGLLSTYLSKQVQVEQGRGAQLESKLRASLAATIPPPTDAQGHTWAGRESEDW